jgi:hypothetical protein
MRKAMLISMDWAAVENTSPVAVCVIDGKLMAVLAADLVRV